MSYNSIEQLEKEEKMKTIQQRIQIRVLCASIALTVITLFSCSQQVFAQQWTNNNNDISNTNSGKVGVGTSSPSEQLSVLVTDASNNGITQVLSVGHTTSGTPAAGLGSALHFRAKRTSDGLTSSTGFIGGVWENPTAEHGALVFAPTISGNGYGTERMRITSGGNVGIGTSNPTAMLEVAGNVNVTGTGNITAAGTIEAGNIKAKYQDVAEWVPAAHSLPPGTVVTLDPTRSNHVAASSQAYDTRVAGVISAQPGIALGEQGENKVLVATTGRVRIKVIASDPIQVGDLLVTSDIPGVAMKSQPLSIGGVQLHRPGTLVGKALEPLAKGQGEILVLLSLQ